MTARDTPTEDLYARAKEIFLELVDRSPAERRARLEMLGARDPELRRCIEALLDQDAAAEQEERRTHDPLIGRVIGGYHIRTAIASGGMGTVYEATQEHPKRVVALKVMRAGIASRSALRRFQYEAEILGRLKHPGVAQIFEAGVHYDESPREDGEGLPYFVMEYIAGAQTIVEYVQSKKLTTRARLELFAQVCDAVECGHRQGIIHRDLKPANILVDSSGRVKVIDFGVARATDSDLAITTMQTNLGQLVGTVQYMSPEQCAGDPHDLDIRSDVYSLGVTLYEVLTNRPPYDLRDASVVQATRRITDAEAPRPSSIDRSLRGDIETIVMKALEKSRDRRYQSAAALGDDIRRYLRHEPIEARPPSAAYHLSKFARRHRALVTGAVAAAIALVVTLIALSVGYREAEAGRAEAEAVTAFLESMLASVNPEELGREVLVVDVLDESAASLGSSFADRPAVEGRMRHTVGSTYRALGAYPAAQTQLERALELRRSELGDRDPATLATLNELATAHFYQQRYDDAERLFREAFDGRRATLGTEHRDTFESMHDLAVTLRDAGRADEAEPMLRDAVAGLTRVSGPDDPYTLRARNNLGVLLFATQRYDEAEREFRETWELRSRVFGEDELPALESLDNLAMTLRQRNDLDGAAAYMEQTLAARRARQGASHPDTAAVAFNLGLVRRAQARHEEAQPLFALASACWTTRLGADHAQTLMAVKLDASTLLRLGRFDDAATPLNRLIATHQSRGEFDEARALLTGWRAAIAATHGADDPRCVELNARLLALGP
ncbi:MAG: tetratricopeptide repeat protein [Phycisphaerales bacterium]